MDKKIGSLLLTLVLLSASLGYVIAQNLWSSQTFTHSIIIESPDTIQAKANFMPSTALTSGPGYAEIPTTDEFIDLGNGKYYIWVILGDSDVDALYLSVTSDIPEGATMDVQVGTQTYLVGSGSQPPVMLGSIAVNGSESMQIIRNADALWIFGSTWGTNYRFIRVEFTFGTTGLAVGVHDFNVTVHLSNS